MLDVDRAVCYKADTRRYSKLAWQPSWGGPSLLTLHENGALAYRVLFRSAEDSGHGAYFRAFGTHLQAAEELASLAPCARTLLEVVGPRTPSLVHFRVSIDDFDSTEGPAPFFEDAVQWAIGFLNSNYLGAGSPLMPEDLLCATTSTERQRELLVIAPYSLPNGHTREEFKKRLMASDQGKSIQGRCVQVFDHAVYTGGYQQHRGVRCVRTMHGSDDSQNEDLQLMPANSLGSMLLCRWKDRVPDQILQGMISYNVDERAFRGPLPDAISTLPEAAPKRVRTAPDPLLREWQQLNPEKTAALMAIVVSTGGGDSQIGRWESESSVLMLSSQLPRGTPEEEQTGPNGRKIMLTECVDKRKLHYIIDHANSCTKPATPSGAEVSRIIERGAAHPIEAPMQQNNRYIFLDPYGEGHISTAGVIPMFNQHVLLRLETAGKQQVVAFDSRVEPLDSHWTRTAYRGLADGTGNAIPSRVLDKVRRFCDHATERDCVRVRQWQSQFLIYPVEEEDMDSWFGPLIDGPDDHLRSHLFSVSLGSISQQTSIGAVLCDTRFDDARSYDMRYDVWVACKDLYKTSTGSTQRPGYDLGACYMGTERRASSAEQLVLLQRYYNRLDENGQCVMAYHQRNHFGRHWVSAGFGIQNMSKKVRHAVCQDIYWDIDMTNAHPTFLSFYCHGKGIPCQHLDEYIRNREAMLRELQAVRGCDRGDAKQEYLAIMNGSVVEDVDRMPRRFRNYYYQCQQIRDAVSRLEPAFRDLATRTRAASGRAGYNIDGTTTNYLLCDLENQCLMIAVDHLTAQGVQIDVLVFDGLMVRKSSVDEQRLPGLLDGLKARVKLEMGCEIEFLVKPMTEGLAVPAGLAPPPPNDGKIGNNWYVDIEDGRVYAKYTCEPSMRYAPRYALGTMPALHDVWREQYTFVDTASVPRVRPFYESEYLPRGSGAPLHQGNVPILVDCTTCGGGKSHQTFDCIGRDHSSSGLQDAPKGDKVIIILHRRQLCGVFFQRLQGLGGKFDFYLEQTEVPKIESTRLVVCVNSLHKVVNREWDLVVIDEVPEVLHAVCTMSNGPRGLKLAVDRKLRSILTSARRALLLSANAEVSVYKFLEEVKRVADAHWQMNAAQIHKSTTYKIKYVTTPVLIKDSEKQEMQCEIALREIYDRLDAGLNLVIPCAEVGDLETLLGSLVARYGEKDAQGNDHFIAVTGPMSNEQKEANIALVQSNRYRAVLFSSCIDCGHSFENEDLHYDLVIFRLHNRSISAQIAFQLAWRFRRTRLNEIIFLCNPAMRDYAVQPGYEHEQEPPVDPAKLLRCPPDAELRSGVDDWKSVEKCKRWLDVNCETHQEEVYHIKTARSSYRLVRKRAPREVTLQEAEDELTAAARVHEYVKEAEFAPEASGPEFQLSSAVRDMLSEGRDLDMASMFQQSYPLLRRMAKVLQDERNLKRNLMPELKRQIALTGANVPRPEFVSLPEKEETTRAAEFLEVAARRDEESLDWSCRAILAPAIANAEARELTIRSRSDGFDDAQAVQLESAWIHAAFGDLDGLKAAIRACESGARPGHYDLSDELKGQVKLICKGRNKGKQVDGQRAFLAMCECSCVRLPLDHPMHVASVATLLEANLSRSSSRDKWEFVEKRRHDPFQMTLFHRMLEAAGFVDMFDTSQREIPRFSDRRDKIHVLLQEYRHSKKQPAHELDRDKVITRMSEVLAQALCIRVAPPAGERLDRNGFVYTIQRARHTDHWPAYRFSHYEHWREFARVVQS